MLIRKAPTIFLLLAVAGCDGEAPNSAQTPQTTESPPVTMQLHSEKLEEQRQEVFASIAAAGGEFGQSCAQILAGDNIYDERRMMSGSYRIQQYYNWACESKFETASDMKNAGMKLSIPLEGLPIPLGLDAVFSSANFKESLHQWCATAWSTLTDQVTRQEFSRVVDAGMVSAYKSCIDAEKDTLLQKFGVFAYAIPQNINLKDFLVKVELKAMDFNNPIITSIEGSDVDCTIGGKAVKNYKATSTSFTMNCKKPSDNAASIAVNTDKLGTSPFVNLPGTTDGLIMEMDQRTKGLAQAILKDRNAVSTRLDTINNRFDKVRFNATACLVVETGSHDVPACPPGFRDTGFTEKDTRPGGCCGYGTICRVCYTVDP
ncbi:hypothetical protein [Pseudomonas chlororaphis]|uniref:hypothetical protein n=1 Tax=Pseudomonas chlororaphis TaxID=587753 RepID=UPI000F563AF2|nr:hypothetical protein [Pseudomonas chlororaphis]AZD75382.1 hypothetical protein C4K16_5046 [Pseudomonas chlororaphis subsp. aurantiaca]